MKIKNLKNLKNLNNLRLHPFCLLAGGIFLLSSFVSTPAYALSHWEGWCQQGGQKVQTLSMISTTQVQQSYPFATLTVYQTNVSPLTKTVLFADQNGSTPLSNPFTCTAKGGYSFWAADGLADLQFSGTGIAAPFTVGAVTGINPAALSPFGIDISQNAPPTYGGYIKFAPVTYNPYDSSMPCYDIYGNLTQQPLPVPGLQPFGLHDVVMWNSLSPLMPADGRCGPPLNVDLDYGLNVNTYFYARGGLATDQPYYNSIQTFTGGVQGITFVAAGLYPPNTLVCTASASGTCTGTRTTTNFEYLGGHIDSGHSIGPPSNGTIATTTNPFSGGEGLVAGQIYYDDALHCERVYDGAAWGCIGSGGGGGGAPGGVNTSVQYNVGGTTFGGSTGFLFNDTTKVLQITGGTPTSGMQAPVFSSTNTGSNFAVTSATGTFSITGAGNAAFQTVSATSTFNSLATGATSAFQQASGTFVITGAGDAAFQSLALTNGWTAGAGAYRLTGAGALTVASCVGCGGSVAGGNTQVQYNNSGVFAGSGAFTWNNGSSTLTVAKTTPSSGIISPLFNANVAGLGGADKTFQNSDGSFTVGFNGLVSMQAGVATSTFNSLATGATAAFQQGSGTFVITGAGNAAFQSVALTNGITTGSGSFGLSGTGALTVASCVGCGGSVAGGNTQVQYNNSGVFAGSANFAWNNGASSLIVTRSGSGSGVISPTFNANIAGLGGTDKTFQNSDGSYSVTYNGIVAMQAGVATGTFNSLATGGTAAFQQGSGTFVITGAGNAAFQSLALTNGWTAGAGTYGLTGGGALTVASCTGCGGSVAGANTQVQFNNGGVFGASSNFAWNNGTSLLTVTRTGSGSGIVSPVFNANVGGLSGVDKTFQNSDGSFTMTYNGAAAMQSLSVTGNISNSGGTISTGGLTTGGIISAGGFSGGFLGGTTLSLSSSLSAVSGNFQASAGCGAACLAITGGINLAGFQTVSGVLTATGGLTATSSGAGIKSFAGYQSNGLAGITGGTCSHFEAGICTSP